MDRFEITKEIVLKLIETGKIVQPTNQNGSAYPTEEANKKYVEEVCKAYETVYRTVHKAEKGEFH